MDVSIGLALLCLLAGSVSFAGTTCDDPTSLPAREGPSGFTCRDLLDNDCDGLIDLDDPSCASANLLVQCALPPVGPGAGDCTGAHRIRYRVTGAGPGAVVNAELLALDVDGRLLESATVQDGDIALLRNRVGQPARIDSQGSRHRVLAPVPLLRVRVDDGVNSAEAYCANAPYLGVMEPSGRVVSASHGALARVVLAIPQVDPATLDLRVDGVDILAALGVDPAVDLPGGPFDGTALIDGREVAVTDLWVRAAPFTAPASNTLTMTLSGLGPGGHAVLADGDPLPGFIGTPSPRCPSNDVRDMGDVAVLGIEITSPAPGEVTDLVPTPVLGQVLHGRPIQQVTVNGREQDISGQVRIPGNGTTTVDQFVVGIDTQLDQTDLQSDVAGLGGGESTFDPGPNRVLVTALDDRANRTTLTQEFAVGDVLSLDAGEAEAPGETEVEGGVLLGIESEKLAAIVLNSCEALTPVINDAIRDSMGAFVYEKEIPTDSGCNPLVAFQANGVTVDELRCETILEDGRLTLMASPRVTAMDVSARGECGSCMDIGQDRTTLSVSIDVGLDLQAPTIRIALDDWKNGLSIDPDRTLCDGGPMDGEICATDDDCIDGACVADDPYVRFLKESLSFPQIDAFVNIVDSTVRDRFIEIIGFSDSQDIRDGIVAAIVEEVETGFRNALNDRIDFKETVADPVIERVVHRTLTVPIADLAKANVSQRIGVCVAENGEQGDGCTRQEDCPADQTCMPTGSCTDDPDATCVTDEDCSAGTCDVALDLDALRVIRSLIAQDTFETTAAELSVGIKTKFTPTVFDPSIPPAPGYRSTPAVPPVAGSPDASKVFGVLADDAIDQALAATTAVGELTAQCAAPSLLGTPATIGELFSDCASGEPVPGLGLCTGMGEGDCESLTTVILQGSCWGARGVDCEDIPRSLLDAAEELEVCKNTPVENLDLDQPILYCGTIDSPPQVLIQDDGVLEEGVDVVPVFLRLNDITAAVAVDRQGDGIDGPLPTIPDCTELDADRTADCVLTRLCLDVNLEGNLTLNGSAIGIELAGFQPPEIAACGGGVDLGSAGPTAFDELIGTLVERINAELPTFEESTGLPLENPELVGITTSQSKPGFDDYVGLRSAEDVPELCGNDTCDPGEECGFSAEAACALDCGLCPAGDPCEAPADCASGICCDASQPDCDVDEYGTCVTGFQNIGQTTCGGTCGMDEDCMGGACNLSECVPKYSLTALSPCSTGLACRSRSCSLGLCEQICGDGYCDGTETCGKDNDGLSCVTDCGLCPDGYPCVDSRSCLGGVCNLGLCATAGSVPNGGLCSTDVACASGLCNLGICIEPGSLDAGSLCASPAACRNGSCLAGVCEQICGDGYCDGTETCGKDDDGLSCNTDCGKCENGKPCVDNDTCASGACNLGLCVAAGSVPNDGLCSTDVACAGGACNFGVCTDAGSLPAGSLCSTGAACESSNCIDGVCKAVCGDGICEDLELCGSDDSGASCNTDCGLCPDDAPCILNADCQSGVCNLFVCVEPNSLPALDPCDEDAACRSGSCAGGLCAQVCGDGSCDGTETCGKDDDGLSCLSDCGKCPNGTPCIDDDTCAGGACNLGLCTDAGSLPSGSPCTTGVACQSGSCVNGVCETFCGDGTCEGLELCGSDDSAGTCNTDCGLCPNNAPCTVNADCQSDVCNFFMCVEPNSVPALDPCDEDAACRSGSCVGALCAQVCGDGYCDGTEICGKDDDGLLCRTDCGLCPNDRPCTVNADCQSDVCNFFVCVEPNSVPALDPCDEDAACRSGSCVLGLCAQVCGDGFCDGEEKCGKDDDGLSCRTDCGRCPNGSLCADDDTCQSRICYLGTCRRCLPDGALGCGSDGECCSGDCFLGVCI